ncbi:MAG: cyclic nucleotide-binding domain-containing protein [Candidatus Cloacimonetes bacterium]|nr:cyclic nucleotide-binding domain-containing protein [Candidatus Cloacimonadota bacterium]HNZ06344.1 cyclic nucleotide-binding domain-containing protein [Candidatus Cloacimonadota bacterium]HOH78828.1 cyclic nucleotide-binding domain-containing protein [Candidatus Cloacimonadota bacterium]HPN39894.1 cyclic nucleotide-binding domain-containing protein [Candidatus Cloacimonadota bacterium]
MNIYIRSQDRDLCKYLDDRALGDLNRFVREAGYPIGAVICKQGERIDSFLVVIEGELALVSTTGKTLGHVYTGEMVNELHYLKDHPAPWEIRAVRPTRVAVISFTDMNSFVDKDPERAARIQAAINDSLCLKNIRLTHLEN